MCLIAAIIDVWRERPLIVAMNRDEHFDRPGEPPSLISRQPRILAGRDSRAAGTWLGVNEHGLIVALANRRDPDKPDDPARPSRGTLCLDALHAASAPAAIDLVARRAAHTAFNGFTLLACDLVHRGIVDDLGRQWRDVMPGVIRFSNGGYASDDDPRSNYAAGELARIAGTLTAPQAVDALQKLLGQHDAQPPTAQSPCNHHQDRGTVSSTIIALDARGKLATYLHADGPPCRTAYQELKHLLPPAE